ncbi:hypothetical protein GGI22_005867, partial [Coemansia erecta]
MITVANGSTIRHLNSPAKRIMPSPPSYCASTNSDETKPVKPVLSILVPSSPTAPPKTQQHASSQPWMPLAARHSTKATLITAASSSPFPPAQYMPTAASATTKSCVGSYRTPASRNPRHSSNAYGTNAVDGTLSLTVRPAGWTRRAFGPSIRRLGAGTGGCVDLHRTAATSKVVAIKTLQNRPRSAEGTREAESRQPEKGGSSVLSRRVLEELGIAVNMRHRNIVSTHEVIVETDRTCYVVMEACVVDLLTLIQGRQQNLLSSGCMLPPSDKNAMDGYFVQLVRGVHYLHSIGVGHRDLKLDNICVTEQGVLKIVDFGCATLFRRRIQQHQQAAPKGSAGNGSSSSARMAPRTRATPYSVPSAQRIHAPTGSHGHQYVETMSYGMCGSDPYMAPELFSNGYYMAPKVDIWALGIIYFAMQNQQFPWSVAQASCDVRYKEFEKSPADFVATWFSATPTAKGGGFGSLGSWSPAPSSPGVNFLNMTQKKCHSDDDPHAFHAADGERTPVRRLFCRMLDTNPSSRADINEIVDDPWFKSMCQQSDK